MEENVKGIKFELPTNPKLHKCKGCGTTIIWVKTNTGKMMPVDTDGTSHFATCPKADDFRRDVKGGTVLDAETIAAKDKKIRELEVENDELREDYRIAIDGWNDEIMRRKEFEVENHRKLAWIQHFESCEVCNEGFQYGMCEEKKKIRGRAMGAEDDGD